MGRKLQVEIVGDASSLSRALGLAGSSASSFGAKLGSVLRKGALVGGAALAGLGGLSVKSAIDFESSFAGVRKTVNATEAQFGELESGIRGMARSIPVGVNQLNEIAESAGQLGIQRKAILGFTRVVADMGVTTNLVGDEAASSMAKLANITKMPQTEFKRLGSTIVALGNAGASTEADIVALGLRLAATGTQVGMTIPQILGMANAMSSVGIEAEAGGSAMSTVLAKMASAVAGGGKGLEAFAKVAGVSGAAFQKSFEDDAAGALVTFLGGLAKVKSEGGNVFKTLEDLGLGGLRVKDTLLRLAGAGDLFTDSVKLGNKAWAEQSALGKEAAERYKTTASQLQLVKNNLIDLGISVGQSLLPALSKALRGVTKFLESLRGAEGLRAKIDVVFEIGKGAISGLAGKLNALLFGEMKKKPIDVGDGIIKMGTVKTQGLVGQIGAALSGANWSAVGIAIAGGIATGLQTAGNLGASLAQTIANGIKLALTQIPWVDVGTAAGPGLASAMAVAVASLLDPSFWAQHWDLVVAVAGAALLGKFKLFANLPLVGPILSSISKGVGAMLGPLAKLGGDAVGALGRGIAAGFPEITAVFSRLSGAVKGGLSAFPGALRTAALEAVEAFGRSLGFLVREALEVIGRLVSAVAGRIRSLVQPFELGARLAVQGLVNGFKGLVGAAGSAVSAAANAVRAKAGAFLAAGMLLGQRVVLGAVTGLVALALSVAMKISGAVGVVAGMAGDFFSAAYSIGTQIVSGVLSGLAGLAGKVAGAVKGAISAGIGAAGGLLRGSGDFMFTKHVVGKPMAQGVILGFLDGTKDLPQKVSDRLRAALEAGRQAVEGARSILSSAFQRLASDAMRAFDAETDRMMGIIDRKLERTVAKIDAQIAKLDLQMGRIEAGADAFRDAPTESEAEIARIEKTRAHIRLLEAQAEAVRALAEATAAGDAEAIAAAQRRLETANEDLKLEELRAKAAEERAAKEAAADAIVDENQKRIDKKKGKLEEQKTAAEARAEARKKELQADRDLEKRNFEDALADLEKYLTKRGASWATAHAELMKLFDKYHIDYKTAGNNLGKSFAKGMIEATVEVEKAAAEIARIVEKYLKVKSPTEKGPMSDLDGWWSDLGKTLIGGLETRSIGKALAGAIQLPAGGRAAAFSSSTVRTLSAGGGAVGGGQVVLEATIPVYIDGREVSRTVKKELLNDGRLNPTVLTGLGVTA